MLGSCFSFYDKLHMKLNETVLTYMRAEVGKKEDVEDDAEEQKEGLLATQYAAFVEEATKLNKELADLKAGLGSDAGMAGLEEGLEVLSGKRMELKKRCEILEKPYQTAMEEVQMILLNLGKKNKPEDAGPEKTPDEAILDEMKDLPWKQEICSDLVNMKRDLHRILEAQGLDFNAQFNNLRRKVLIALEEVKYVQLKDSIRKPKLCAQVEDCLLDCDTQIQELVKKPGDLSPKDFKKLAKPVGRLQDKVEAVMANEVTRQYKF